MRFLWAPLLEWWAAACSSISCCGGKRVLRDEHVRRPVRILWLLAALTVVCTVAFLTVGADGRWDFVLPFRARNIATMLLVGYAVAVSTVLFQTATENRLLT